MVNEYSINENLFYLNFILVTIEPTTTTTIG